MSLLYSLERKERGTEFYISDISIVKQNHRLNHPKSFISQVSCML